MEPEEDIKPAAGSTPARRLIDLRWPLLAGVVLVVIAAIFQRIEIWEAAVAIGVLLLCSFIGINRKTSSVAQRLRVRSRAVWPDVGMRTAIDAFPLPCIIVDHKAIVRHANHSVEDLIGAVQPGDPLAYRLRIPQVLAALDRVAAGGPAESVEWREKVPAEKFLEARFSPVRLPNSQRRHPIRPDFIVIAFFDLTRLHQLDRMRADFVANASHELRTPLASLTGFIETLQGPARDDAAARENFLAIMLDQANRMGRLTNDLLSLSRVEMKGPVRPDQEADLCPVIRHVADALEPVAAELNVRINVALQNDRMIIRGDHDELVQVFQNLVENAIRYGASGELIEISDTIERHGSSGDLYYQISVRDWGPGIAPEHLPRLTERFYRADIEKSRMSHGTGLGLAIVKHIVNRHGGRLLIRSAPGEGATFTVALPRVSGPDIRVTDKQKALLKQ